MVSNVIKGKGTKTAESREKEAQETYKSVLLLYRWHWVNSMGIETLEAIFFKKKIIEI